VFDWFIEKYSLLIKSVPPLFTIEGSPSFALARTMLGLVLFVLLLYLFTITSLRSVFTRCIKRATAFVRRKN
jgi:hypothetical protein